MSPDQRSPVETVEDERYCVRCSYALRGLPVAGKCPECGTPVARALQGDLLEHSSPEYLQRLERGITFVIVATVGQLVVALLAVALELTSQIARVNLQPLEMLAGWLEAGCSLVVLLGWWQFSGPDPAIVTENTGTNARKVLRVSAIVSAAGMIAATVMEQAGSVLPLSVGAAESLTGLAMFPYAVASLVIFFASLIYLRWLARRIPDAAIDAAARRYLWLLPLVYIVLACIVVGPFIAAIMYLLLLNRVRLAIRAIRQRQQPLPDIA